LPSALLIRLQVKSAVILTELVGFGNAEG
jgi:hypothetical protein